MSDSSKRRGTDFETLRSLGTEPRAPREAEDPLAELARLVSQGAPAHDQDFHDDPQAYAPQLRSSGPRAAYVPPAVEPALDRLDPLPLGFDDDEREQAPHARSYGAPMAPSYNQDTDFFSDEPLRGSQGGYANLGEDFDARSYRDDFDAEDESDAIYPDAGEEGHPSARRRRGGPLLTGTALGALLVVGLGYWAYSSFSGGGSTPDTPPVIAAPDQPVKVVAEAKPVEKNKLYEDRVLPGSEARVGPGPEEPLEKPRLVETPPEPEPAAEPGTTESVAEERPEPRRIDMSRSEPAGGGPSDTRIVRTIPITPSGAPAAQQPAPLIEGTGVAQGMSMQPGNDFGIMASESAPQQQAPSAPAFAAEVPMPQPRPMIARAPQPSEPVQAAPAAAAPQTRAATATPTPGGPPSSPQPQVTITNSRPLQPQNAPPPAANPQSSVSPPAAQQPQRPVQIAAASPVPVQQPQVATIAGTSGGAFGVQLTAQRSEEEAVAAFNTLKARYPQVLGPYNPVVARADLGPDRGVFYRAMVPAQTQADASNLCIQFKSAGVDCIVQRR